MFKYQMTRVVTRGWVGKFFKSIQNKKLITFKGVFKGVSLLHMILLWYESLGPGFSVPRRNEPGFAQRKVEKKWIFTLGVF